MKPRQDWTRHGTVTHEVRSTAEGAQLLRVAARDVQTGASGALGA